MNRIRFQLLLLIGFVAFLSSFMLAAHPPIRAFAQAAVSETPKSGVTSAFITQTYTEPINVRTGPSTVDYPVIGQLPIGATAPALAASPGREWIEISFPAGPGGVGWIYAGNVQLTGTLQVAEPPPTAVPFASATIDPTLAAAFNIQPTETRLPTFTPAPPIEVPDFPNHTDPVAGVPMGITIVAIAAIGAVVLGISFFGRR